MTKVLQSNAKIVTNTFSPALRILLRDPHRIALTVNNSVAAAAIRIWWLQNEIVTGGLLVAPQNPNVTLDYDTYGPIVKEEWWLLNPGAGNITISIIDTVETEDFTGKFDATRQQPAIGNNQQRKRNVLRPERRPDRDIAIVTPDDTLHDIIRRYRRFGSVHPRPV